MCTKERKQRERKKAFSVSCSRAFVTVQWKRKFVKSSIVVYMQEKNAAAVATIENAEEQARCLFLIQTERDMLTFYPIFILAMISSHNVQ